MKNVRCKNNQFMSCQLLTGNCIYNNDLTRLQMHLVVSARCGQILHSRLIQDLDDESRPKK